MESLRRSPVAGAQGLDGCYLAAFALTGGFELVTTDTAFTQYGGIELRLLAK